MERNRTERNGTERNGTVFERLNGFEANRSTVQVPFETVPAGTVKN